MKLFLTIIIPMFNEAENLKGGALEDVAKNLKSQKFPWEVIISDDGSTDGSKDLVRKFVKGKECFRLLENSHGGKPFAIRAGIKEAKGEICLFTDMDQSTPISELDKLLPFFDEGFDVVIGSRGTERKDFPWYRKLMSWGFRSLRRVILLKDLIDTQCGFKATRTAAGRKIFAKMTIFEKRSEGWKVGAWDVEFLFLAEKLGYKVKEVSIKWVDKDTSLGKKQNFPRESKEMFLEIARVKVNDGKGKYDK